MLGRLFPPRAGYWLADALSGLIANRRSWELVRSVRANQWVVSQGELSGEKLDQAARQVFRNIARYQYELYHYLDNPQAMQDKLVLNNTIQRLMKRSEFEELGLVAVGVHLGNYDLILRTLYSQGIKALALTIPEMTGGYETQFNLRRNAGVPILPLTKDAFRQAVTHLQSGGMIATGLDRPLPDVRHKPRFFGRPSHLPVHYISLALKANVPVVVIAFIMQADGTYTSIVSDPIPMQPCKDRQQEIIVNAEAILRIAEGYIKQAPQLWSMTLPVWPDVLDAVP